MSSSSSSAFAEGHIDNIFGPISLSEHYNPEFDKHVYVFGEHHKRTEAELKAEQPCPNSMRADRYLQTILFNNLDKKIDVFLETELLTKDKPYPDVKEIDVTSPASQVARLLASCLALDKKDCLYPNVRAHFTDYRPRNLPEKPFTETDLTPFSFFYLLHFLLVETEPQYLLMIPKIMDRFAPFFENKETFLKWVNSYFPHEKIRKQVDNIRNEFVRKRVLDNYSKCQSLLLDDHDFFPWSKIQTIINHYIGAYISNLTRYQRGETSRKEAFKVTPTEQKFLDLHAFLPKIQGCTMDLYLLARMFRHFRDGQTPRYIIILAGDWHADNYREILKQLNFVEIASVRNEIDRCLHLKGFTIPFFSRPPVQRASRGEEKEEAWSWPDVTIVNPEYLEKIPCDVLKDFYTYSDWREFVNSKLLPLKISPSQNTRDICENVKREFKKHKKFVV